MNTTKNRYTPENGLSEKTNQTKQKTKKDTTTILMLLYKYIKNYNPWDLKSSLIYS